MKRDRLLVAGIQRRFRGVVERVCPEHAKLAMETLERVPPQRWQLEWFLPWWLGEAFGLDKETARELVLSNVLGLVAVRLRDDAADGELEAAGLRLAEVLERAALGVYAPYFQQRNRFWGEARRYLGEWREATGRVNDLRSKSLKELANSQSEAAKCIAALGAPLKIPARAIHLLTGQGDWTTLKRLLEHTTSAAVLLDHVVDLADDLRAGRHNFFVGAVSKLPQTKEHESQNRIAVSRAWMEAIVSEGSVRSAAGDYFEVIYCHIRNAQLENEELTVEGLAEYLDTLGRDVRRTQRGLMRTFGRELKNASRALFGEKGRGRKQAWVRERAL